MSDIQAQAFLQGTNYDKIFVDGFPRQIRLRTITFRVLLIMKELQRGSFRAAYTRNGNQQVRSSGFMENVRPFFTPLRDTTLHLYA